MTFAQSPPDMSLNRAPSEEFSVELDSLRQLHHLPGLAAAIVREGEIVYAEGFGYSHFDTGDGTPYRSVTPNTPFWIASVTKSFLGLAFLQLAEEGIVDLEDPINDMPGWDGFCNWLANSRIVFGKDLRCDARITLRNVLNHTVNGEPGTRFQYNPIMYSRLSRYLEYVYGNPIATAEAGHNTLARHIQDKILGPAGMDRTMASMWQEDRADVFFDMAQGYGYMDGGFVKRLRPDRHLAGGAGIVSTARDLAKYAIALDIGSIASAEVVRELFTPASAPDGTVLPYAFGWYVQEYRGERLLWHGGWDEEAGFSALVLRVPDRKLSLVLLANGEGLYWGNPLDRAEVEGSPFARLFLERFVFKTR